MKSAVHKDVTMWYTVHKNIVFNLLGVLLLPVKAGGFAWNYSLVPDMMSINVAFIMVIPVCDGRFPGYIGYDKPPMM